jgi:hypothetical protein
MGEGVGFSWASIDGWQGAMFGLDFWREEEDDAWDRSVSGWGKA